MNKKAENFRKLMNDFKNLIKEAKSVTEQRWHEDGD